MSNPIRLVAVIAVVVIAGVAAINLLGSSPGVGGFTSPSPTASPPAATPSAAPTSFAGDTSTWTTYTSRRFGFSVGHPADWTVRPATRDWTFPADATADPFGTAMETFVSADSSVAASAWSVAVTPGTTVIPRRRRPAPPR